MSEKIDNCFQPRPRGSKEREHKTNCKQYWWQAGAMWGLLIDYFQYTNDPTYNSITMQALLSQVGPNNDYMMPLYELQEANDDQAFWGFATSTLSSIQFSTLVGYTDSDSSSVCRRKGISAATRAILMVATDGKPMEYTSSTLGYNDLRRRIEMADFRLQ